jgi:hypothetical protein
MAAGRPGWVETQVLVLKKTSLVLKVRFFWWHVLS